MQKLRRPALGILTAAAIMSPSMLPAHAANGAAEAGSPAVIDDAGADLGPEEPTVVLPLTDDDGAALDTATAGLERHAAEPAGQETLEEVALLSEAIVTDPFVVAAFRWDAADELQGDAGVFLRVHGPSGWSPWSQTCTCADCMALAVGADEGPGGPEQSVDHQVSAPYVTGAAGAVQIQFTGDAEALPAGLELVLIPANPGPETVELAAEAIETTSAPADLAVSADPRDHVADLNGAAGAHTSATAAPAAAGPIALEDLTPVISRAGWGAPEHRTTWRPVWLDLHAATVHHTAGSNDHGPEDGAGIVRGIHHLHTDINGWGDIGYNFLVDQYGQVFEGRSGTLQSRPGRLPQGAHAGGFNEHTMGISIIGDFTTAQPPQVSLDAVRDMITWQFARADITDLDTDSGIIAPDDSSRTYTERHAEGSDLGRIFTHGDVNATSCPGPNLYSEIPQLHAEVELQLAGATPFRDITAESGFVTEILWLYDNGIASGWEDGTFRPTAPIQRQAMASFLFQFADRPEHGFERSYALWGTLGLPDVPEDHEFVMEIDWLVDAGVASGYADGTFRPGQPVTREAMAAFLYRLAGEPEWEAPETSPFTDVSTDEGFYHHITWLAQTDITTGYPDGTFRPRANVSREATAAFLFRFGEHFDEAGD